MIEEDLMMRSGCKSLALLVLSASLASFEAPAMGQTAKSTPAAVGPDQYQAMLTTYCFTCHSTRAKIGGLALDSLDLQSASSDAPTWEKVLRKLRGNLMPPPGSPK